MTHCAIQFISPLIFQALSANTVSSTLLDNKTENAMAHINLARWADKIIIAPATANIIAKISMGLADDLLSTLCLAADCPLYIAPAMNQIMWHQSITQDNIQRLKNRKIHIIGPESGEQACGETGLGVMSEASKIVAELRPYNSDNSNDNCSDNLSDNLLKDSNILISVGPTREPLDPVRYISNRSSGKMGYALAHAALRVGARVTLVSGPVALSAQAGIKLIKVETAEQMYQAIMPIVKQHDIYIGAAAVADYSPAIPQPEKIKKQHHTHQITLKKNKDILAEVATLPERPRFVVGFAAETQHLAQHAQHKLQQKNLDMIAANWVAKTEGGFDDHKNALEVFWQGGQKTLAMCDKQQLATQLITLIAERIHEKNIRQNTT